MSIPVMVSTSENAALGKRTLRESAAKHVSVNVKDGLACRRSRIENEAVLAVGVRRRQLICHRNHLCQEGGIPDGKLGYIRVLLSFWNDE